MTSPRTLRHLRWERRPPTVEGGAAEAREAKRSRILSLPQLRPRSRKLVKRLLQLPRLMEVSEGATVATSARETKRRRSLPRPLSTTKATTDRRVARIAPLEMILAARLSSRETNSVGHLQMSTTLAEKCLAATTPVPEVSTEEEEEAELSSRRELHTTEAMLPLTKLATATGTCQATEVTRISTSPSTTGRTAEILVTEISMTSSPDQATTLLPEDQSDLLQALPCPPTTSHHREGTWGTSSSATTLLPHATELSSIERLTLVNSVDCAFFELLCTHSCDHSGWKACMSKIDSSNLPRWH